MNASSGCLRQAQFPSASLDGKAFNEVAVGWWKYGYYVTVKVAASCT
jgi:hypothetical protein